MIRSLNRWKAELSHRHVLHACPFEDALNLRRVSELDRIVREKGARSICLAETIGTCHPRISPRRWMPCPRP